jgi:4'-phosphopantetheinyl transferase
VTDALAGGELGTAVIELLIIGDHDGSLRTREARDALTLSQLRGLGVGAGELQRRCACGSSDHGAPFLEGGASIGISRSRSRESHAFAVSTSGAVLGVDIELASRARQALRAAPRFIGAGDAELGGDAIAALRTFVRKEAILKARGTGLHADPRAQPTLAASDASGWSRTQDGWWLYERELDDLLVCIAAAERQAVQLRMATSIERHARAAARLDRARAGEPNRRGGAGAPPGALELSPPVIPIEIPTAGVT